MVIILMAGKNEFHQESCFEATVTGLVGLVTQHHDCLQAECRSCSTGQGTSAPPDEVPPRDRKTS